MRWNRQMAAAAVFATTLVVSTRVHAAVPPITADGLVLIVNKQQPEGRKLAERYAELRHVPADRIIEIDVPDDVEIGPDDFDKQIADVVRKEIDARGLRDKTQCLVTFYGVPLRERDREVSAADQNEVKAILDPSVKLLRGQFQKAIEDIEAVAKQVDPTFKPDVFATNTEQLRTRGAAAEQIVQNGLDKRTGTERSVLDVQLAGARSKLVQMPQLPSIPSGNPIPTPTQDELNNWVQFPRDPQTRAKARDVVWKDSNVFMLLSVVEAQQRALQGGEGEASVDSELSCLWLPKYSKQKWLMNPWHWGAAPALVSQFRSSMVRVSRIDAPTPEIAKRVFEESIAAEDRGLTGDAVIDARGLTGKGDVGSYEACDQSIRNAAKYMTPGSGLKPIFDNGPNLLPDHSSDHAAIYCGWYSVRKYKPTAKFVPGAIAWHVASYEMVTLRSPLENGWCRGLLLDGADVTLGPVGEPYLVAFPAADEFLGAVLSGKTNIAEAYWLTVPITSWKMVLIADPLYRPFAKSPAAKMPDLPLGVKRAIGY